MEGWKVLSKQNAKATSDESKQLLGNPIKSVCFEEQQVSEAF